MLSLTVAAGGLGQRGGRGTALALRALVLGFLLAVAILAVAAWLALAGVMFYVFVVLVLAVQAEAPGGPNEQDQTGICSPGCGAERISGGTVRHSGGAGLSGVPGNLGLVSLISVTALVWFSVQRTMALLSMVIYICVKGDVLFGKVRMTRVLWC